MTATTTTLTLEPDGTATLGSDLSDLTNGQAVDFHARLEPLDVDLPTRYRVPIDCKVFLTVAAETVEEAKREAIDTLRREAPGEVYAAEVGWTREVR